MMLPVERRRALGAFLRSRREALAPARAGGPRRRRTPGLRREEVADLCGISTAWYSWVEQGRDISLSAASLGRLAGGLRLDAAERAYVFELARLRDPAPPPPASEPEPAALLALVDAIGTPAYLLDRLWRRRAWNGAAAALFAPWRESPEPGLLGFVFREAGARSFIRGWEDRARRLVAEFRADAARHPGDPEIEALVAGLARDSPDFARAWRDHAVSTREGGARHFDHPTDGPVSYRQITLVPAGLPDHKLVALIPDP